MQKEFVREKENILHENDLELRREKERSETKLMELAERNRTDIRILQDEFQDERMHYERGMQDMRREYGVLEEKYRNRESRPEVHKIVTSFISFRFQLIIIVDAAIASLVLIIEQENMFYPVTFLID